MRQAWLPVMSRMTYGQELRGLCQFPTTSPADKCTEMADRNNSVIFHVLHYIINLSNCVWIILREQFVIFETNDMRDLQISLSLLLG